ncbi:MAG: alanine--tRNA ligase [Candidatus Omnitrophica bacterium]|nr:alanine--tRNA ligase [Candidatus Omnitrophota bacterium]MDD5553166.1 alanine--tRNA ligase [Candidatus Omnitrophota bacterium]
MKADELRQSFLDFFKEKKHRIAESDSLIPRDDPTVLFTPAGMNQFKAQFMGRLAGFTRAASCQRCLRTDDLEKVGKTPSHHTFFEMLGNFSFGDYFKKEAIAWSWDFLTQELKIPKEKLWVSVYKDDDEAYAIWKDKIGVTEDRIVRLGDKENFWPSEAKEKGPNGPCGPCSEIFFDQAGIVDGCGEPGCGPACACGRFVEVWNLVFTQYNRKEGGRLEPLPKKNIDTGMGLERLTSVMQEKASNFETELFEPLVKEIKSKARIQGPGTDKVSIYPVADHIRAAIFAIYDGVLPSNEGRGYVIRKIIRKSVLHLRALGIKNAFLYKLVPVLSEIMRQPYPELGSRKENIAEIILKEETRFIEALDSSEVLFREKFRELSKDTQDNKKAGEIAFRLYDTYGIPFELTKDWAGRQGIDISLKAFNNASLEQKIRSKSRSSMKGDVFDVKSLHLPATKTSFGGYAKYETKGEILKILKDNLPVDKAVKGDVVRVILDRTVFYPESGGQVGDTGTLARGRNLLEVTDTQKFDKVIVHAGTVKEGSFKASNEIKAAVDRRRRLSIARNHTATHLLQAALRKVLGPHVRQQGSLVASDRLRFDFTHFEDISKEQIDRIEETVNENVMQDLPLNTKITGLKEAKRKGALAFFGEKYEAKVRMVSIGDLSSELCGGTHLSSTGQIGLFKIIQEGSVASGVRRIEAVTGDSALKKLKENEGLISQISDALGVNASRIPQEIEKRLSRIRELEKELSEKKTDSLKASVDAIISQAQAINGIKFAAPVVRDMDSARKMVDMIKEKRKEGIVIFSSTGTNYDDKILWAVGVSEDLFSRKIEASSLNKEIGLELGGSGGGRKDFAQGGGNRPQNYGKAVQRVKDIIGRSL